MYFDETKFTLHPEYEDFIPRVSRIDHKTLGPSGWAMGCLLPIFVLLTFTAFLMVVLIYEFNIKPLLFQVSGHSVTAQVMDCNIITGKHNRQLGHDYTYTYTWEGTTYFDRGSSYGQSLSCSQAMKQPLTVRIRSSDPAHSMLMGRSLSDILMPMITLGLGGWLISGAIAACYMYIRFAYDRLIFYPRLNRSGIRVKGEITHISGDIANRSFHYNVTIKYQFTSPTGKILKGKGQKRRDDLRYGILPPVGTPVVILYADDSRYMAL